MAISVAAHSFMDREDKLRRLREANILMKNALAHCGLCPRRCGVDRRSGKLGYCRAGSLAEVYSYGAHLGEEPPLSGTRGSGTIFFSHCTMRCAYCQNYKFSQMGGGRAMTPERLGGVMLELEKSGCHNINLVSPTHYIPQILQALEMALNNGLSVPIIYNTGGYDLAGIIHALAGIIDIYLPDMRYADDEKARRYSDAPGYPAYNRSALIEMQRQAGDLIIDETGIASRGIIIRLLVLPNDISGIAGSLAFIRDRISPHARLSIMSQYRPTYRAPSFAELSRGVSVGEYKNVVDEAALLGLNEGWIQQMPDADNADYLGTHIKPRRGA